MTNYNSSYNGAYPFSNQSYQIALAASTVVTLTVPGTSANTFRAQFSWPYNANVHVGLNVTPAVPVPGAVTSTPNIELRPDVRFVRGGDVLSFISGSIVTDGSVSLLQVPN